MNFNQPVSHLIHKRYSCRTYQDLLIQNSDLAALEDFTASCKIGPLGNQARFKVVASREGDSTSLKGLGTYGFIKNPTGFIIGTSEEKPGSLEDFGYLMEAILLRATDLGLGSCWLGGTFTKSRFSRQLSLLDGEIIPAVASIGYPADQSAWLDKTIRAGARAHRRRPWENIFFTKEFGNPLNPGDAGNYHEPLDLVRLAPSASNKQPWRVVREGHNWHFFLQRTEKYPPPVFNFILNLADLQRIDMGIAMAHFELSARENGLNGKWIVHPPDIPLPNQLTEYSTTWQEDEGYNQ
ncbi:MAG: nitroreductase family protein [Anaerolineales bacterium]|nr:nitroreductase family protein [Anaerolineales bacterium]